MSNITKSKQRINQQQMHLIIGAHKRLKDDYATLKSTPGLSPFKLFNQKGSVGIPLRLSILSGIDVQNLPKTLPKWNKPPRNDVTFADFCHLDQYLSSNMFNAKLLSDMTNDDVVNAIVSFLLDWPTQKLRDFVSFYPKYSNLCEAVIEFSNLDNGDYVYELNGVPVVRTAIKIIKSHFVPKSEGANYFDWMSLIDYKFIEHLQHVYTLLSNDEIFPNDLIDLIQSDMDLPYRLPNIDVTTLKQYDRTDNLKFITGEACCCKTTIINKLASVGWKSYSRGDLGGFNRKPENRAQVGNLHAALNYQLTQSDVIGDRSFIDNVLWSFLMPACDPQIGNFLQSLFSFLNSNFNEPCIAEYIRHKGVVFIDPRSSANKARQLKRCEDGDPWRGRLKMYANAQFITYYAVARLFGWKVICVPYAEDGTIDNAKYDENVQSIVDFFGTPIPTQNARIRYKKPSNVYRMDNHFPKSVGIYK
ncbi:GrBNV gp17-like protein [Tomelloso virus]|uniref:GrBNV gp17-like protein n=1 Tax=Tomelloso virus TaxID=2053981 RepID=A0A2H4T2P3_9VIRU|nr:GrBNV gp17-like protein [Tomelloso virus]ATY70192.1 GrBNV gp17-like protein [Tomelloso virus]